MAGRVEWLDEVFASQINTTENMYMEESTNSYTKSENIEISFPGVKEDEADILKADGIINSKDPLEIKLDIADGIEKVSVYANGIFCGEKDQITDDTGFIVSNDHLNEKQGKLNVISLIGYDSDGNIVATNYASVKCLDSVPRRKYTISFDSVGGSKVSEIYCCYDDSIDLPDEPKLEGYIFDGWYMDENYKEPFGLKKMPAENILLYAKWTEIVEDDVDDENEKQNETVDKDSEGKDGDNKNSPEEKTEDASETGTENTKDKIYKGSKGYYRISGTDSVSFLKPVDAGIRSLAIPDSVKIKGKDYRVTSIGDKAFYKCKSLRKITIGKNIKHIGKKAFYGCKNLKIVVIKTSKLKKNSIGKYAFKKINSKAVFRCPKKKLKSYKKWIRKSGTLKKAKYKLM